MKPSAMQTDQALDHLTTQLRDKNIHYDELRKVGDTQILVHNLAPDSTAAFRDLVELRAFPIGISRRLRARPRATC